MCPCPLSISTQSLKSHQPPPPPSGLHGWILFAIAQCRCLSSRSLLFFQRRLFRPKWSHFSLPEHTPKLTNELIGMYVTPAEKFHNLLSSISTTRWRYNQGTWALAHNSRILCCTFKNLISTHSLNCAESHDISQAHFCLLLFFFPQIWQMLKTYFF